MKEHDAVAAILKEYSRAVAKFPPFRSKHEGYAILLEEVEELWGIIKSDKEINTDDLRIEAVHVAAMAYRFLRDCIPDD